jgi:hypothetical protein
MRAITPAPNLDELGELRSPKEIAAMYYRGRVSAEWAAAQMPRDKVVMVGKTRHWYDADIRAAMLAKRGAA